jgi:prephenate dehydratase
MKISCLGPQGTFSEEAALKFYPPTQDFEFFSSNDLVIIALANQRVEKAFVPIENSIEGWVNQSIDTLLGHSQLFIDGEFTYPISQQLLATKRIPLSDIRVILSHSQALAQCREFIQSLPAQITVEEFASTTKAIESLKSNRWPIESTAAIGSARAATIYSMAILAANIQNNNENVTRFISISRRDSTLPTGNDKTSIVFSCDRDEPGSLVNVLMVFKETGINMLKVESRPTKRFLGEYLFLVDFGGHRDDPMIKQTIQKIRERTDFLRILGSYPKSLTAQ